MSALVLQLGTHYIDYVIWANGGRHPVAVAGHEHGRSQLEDSHPSPDYILRQILSDYGMSVGGVCGMFSMDNDLSSNRPIQRQDAVDYLKREITFKAEVGGAYLLVVPGAVGRPTAYDDAELERSVETLRLVADLFTSYGVRAAIEPIRAAEVSFVHTFEEAKQYIQAVDHPGIGHINGDTYHINSNEYIIFNESPILRKYPFIETICLITELAILINIFVQPL